MKEKQRNTAFSGKPTKKTQFTKTGMNLIQMAWIYIKCFDSYQRLRSLVAPPPLHH